MVRIAYKEQKSYEKTMKEDSSSSSVSAQIATPLMDEDESYVLQNFLHEWMKTFHPAGFPKPPANFIQELAICAPGWSSGQIIE
jgi:hypothetical protein